MSDAARANAPTIDPIFWNFSAGAWDAEFRAWAAPLLKLSAEQAGLAVIVIGQLIECAWRLRRINTTMADAAALSDRDACRALAEAQRAFSRAQTDYQRWTREIERRDEMAGGRGGAGAAMAARRIGRGSADSAPGTPAHDPRHNPGARVNESVPVAPTQVASVMADTPKLPDPDGSTHIHNFVASGAPTAALQALAAQAVLAALGRPGDPGRPPNRAARRAMKRRHR